MCVAQADHFYHFFWHNWGLLDKFTFLEVVIIYLHRYNFHLCQKKVVKVDTGQPSVAIMDTIFCLVLFWKAHHLPSRK